MILCKNDDVYYNPIEYSVHASGLVEVKVLTTPTANRTYTFIVLYSPFIVL